MKPYITSVWLRSDYHRSFETDETFPIVIKKAIELSKLYPNLYYEEIDWYGNGYFAFFEEKVDNATEIVFKLFHFQQDIKNKLKEIGREKIDNLKEQLLQVTENQKYVIKEECGITIHINGEIATVILALKEETVQQDIDTNMLKNIVCNFKTIKE